MSSNQQPRVRAAIYVRVSQDRFGNRASVEQQLNDCRRFAEERDFNVLHELCDNDISAYTGKRRPAYEELLERIRKGELDAVVVWEQSRLTRQPYELEGYILACEPHSVSTFMVTAGVLDLTTDQGRMVARMTGAVNRYEVDQLRGRVKRGLKSRADKGLPGGGRRPFGFLADKVTHDPLEAAALLDATRRIVAGDSVHGIAREWRSAGLLTVTGKPWNTGQLRALLRRPRNAGLTQHRGQVSGKASWEPIVPVALWTACVGVLNDPSRRSSPGNQPAYLGTFIYRCGALIDGEECQTLMKSWRSGRAGTKIYRCTTPDRTVNHVTAPIAEVDEFVADYLVNGINDRGFTVPTEMVAVPTPLSGDTLKDLNERQSFLTMQFSTAQIPQEDYVAALAAINMQREALKEAVSLPLIQEPEGMTNPAEERAKWDGLSLARRRALVSELADVTILPVGSGVRAPISSRVRVDLKLAQWVMDADEANAAPPTEVPDGYEGSLLDLL
ncbi:recombinase family protein [Pseudonocardia sp. WMMC193]|uniref:recombinase family protein n=1 Tax=Pseudonocardia sp. WMMC193 TaxID=2911965 RepID=UPI001F1F1F39|nr:recombinase family protein [Pseudonocardia sp. WMMC193]MCF7548172.1 recombinase family protein [Pseudonocardia sp. WMMC193]